MNPCLQLDYLRECTQSLPDVELAQLLRLVIRVCETERMLPLDRELCERIAGARRKDELRSCTRVLAQHFIITDEGRAPVHGLLDMSHCARLWPADERYATVTDPSRSRNADHNAQQEQGPVTQRSSNAVRQKRYRDRTEALRNEALAMGLSPRKAAGAKEIQAMIDETLGRYGSVMPPQRSRPSRARTHADLLIPIPNTEENKAGIGVTRAVNGHSSHPLASAAVIAMRAAGLPNGNPSHPELIALLHAGVMPEQLADATRECVAIGKLNFVYILRMVAGRLRDAAGQGTLPTAQPLDVVEKWGGPKLAALVRKNGGLP